MRTRKSAFTLVELLVVIGLIGVLMSILLPTIRSARQQAAMVLCSSTLQQIAKASVLHAQEHRGFMPLAGYVQVESLMPNDVDAFPKMVNDTLRRRYTYSRAIGSPMNAYTLVPLPGALAPYMTSIKLPFEDWDKLDIALRQKAILRYFACASTDTMSQPENPETLAEAISAGQATMVAFTDNGDAWNNGWATNMDYGINEGALGFTCNPKYTARRLRGNLTGVSKPDKLVLYTDARPQSSLPWGFFCPWICWTPSLDSEGAVTLADAWEDNGKAVDRGMFDLKRHGGRMNVAFADGHVQTLHINSSELRQAYLVLP